MSEPPVYVFTGHGDEDPVPHEKREKIPAGITLVTFSQCGVTNNLTDIIGILQKMQDKAPFVDPVTFASREKLRVLLGKDFNIYTPGMPCPQLKYSSLGVHEPPEKNGRVYDLYFRSGVYSLPVKPVEVNPEWKTNVNVIRHKPTRYTLPAEDAIAAYGVPVERVDTAQERRKQVILSSYDGSVFPSQEEQQRIAAGGEEKEVPIMDVFAALKEGVYYWPICRGRATDWPEPLQELVSKIRRTSATGQAERYINSALGKPGGRRRKTRRKHRARKSRRRH